jgi:simple sugar transport system ATP-binding protein
MNDQPPLLELRNVSKSFGGFRALHDVSIVIKPARTLALVGDNGAGKSTLIKILSGVHAPDSGSFLFEGKRVAMRSPRDARRLGIATVYQDLALIDTLSIVRNFFLGAEIKRHVAGMRLLDLPAMRERTEQYLSSIGITRLRSPDEVVAVLSGGERQAIAIARAMYFGAKLLILDEPTSALSVRETRSVLDFVRHANARGIAAILISHNIHHVMPVADTIVALHQGQVAARFDRDEADAALLESVIMHGREGLAGDPAAPLAE